MLLAERDPNWWVPFSGSSNPADDALRLFLVVAGTFIMMIVLRIAWLRFRNGDTYRDSSGWALVSYGGFISVAVYDGLNRFGLPVDWIRVALIAGSLAAGVVAVFTTVRFRPFGYRNHPGPTGQRLADEAEGRAAREAREERDETG